MNGKRLDRLISYLLNERPELPHIDIPDDISDKFTLYRSLVNVRPAAAIDSEYLSEEDELLKEILNEKGITDAESLSPVEEGIYLWKGDITTLRCDAVVNAANSGMTGCYRPCHNCIDNCIHTFAGVRLRYKCDEIIKKQGFELATSQARVTPAYDLPCRYVIHTVGPIVRGHLTNEDCEALRDCYLNCLDAASEYDIGSIAFCCISTGVFGFPQKEAAQIAVETVRKYKRNSDIKVIFNVFKEEDYELYRKLLKA